MGEKLGDKNTKNIQQLIKTTSFLTNQILQFFNSRSKKRRRNLKNRIVSKKEEIFGRRVLKFSHIVQQTAKTNFFKKNLSLVSSFAKRYEQVGRIKKYKND